MIGSRVLLVASACCLISFSAAVSGAPPYTVDWAIQAGSPAQDEGTGVAFGPQGQMYVCGRTNGKFAGNYAGQGDVFLSSYSATGALNWARQFGTSGYESISLAVDAAGNVYVTGQTAGSMAGTNAGGYDVYVRKYNDTGTVIWTRQFGTGADDWTYGAVADQSGYVYLAGHTKGAFPGAVNAGASDFFLTKLDPSGNQLWTRQTGSPGDDWSGGDIAVDAEGNVYATGITYGNLGGTNAGGQDLFLLKYDGEGNQVWGRQAGTASDEHGRGVAVDSRGNVFVCGLTFGNLGGDSAGKSDGVVLAYDTDGNLSWTRQFGSTQRETAWGIAVDGLGNAFVAGGTSGALGPTDPGFADGYVAMLTEAGSVEWINQIGSSSYDSFWGIAMNGPGEAYVVGRTAGYLGGPNAGNYDLFGAKLVPEPGTCVLLALGGLVLVKRKRK